MRRRELIALLGGVVACPSAALAQQSSGKVWRLGFLHAGSNFARGGALDAWKRGLRDLGYLEGKNLIVEARFSDGNFSRLPELAGDIVATQPDAIMAIATPAVLAAQQATGTIPIVMANIADPVGSGFVKSLARPGGRITGTANMSVDYMPKTIELLREL